MPINFASPSTTDNYATAFVPNIQANQTALAQWLDSVQSGVTGTPPTYTKRYNRTSQLFEEFNGSAWATLGTGYATWTGGAFSGLCSFGGSITQAAPNATNIAATASTIIGGAGGNVLAFGQYPTSEMAWIQSCFNNPTMAVYPISLQPLGGNVGINMGATIPTSTLQVNGTIAGVGTGLTGTAASLTAGFANNLNSSIGYAVATIFAGANVGIGQLNANYGSGSSWYNSGWRNDGVSVYLMSSAVQTTQAAASTAAWNSYRPFAWSLTTGAVTVDGSGSGTTFGGQVSVNTSGSTQSIAIADTGASGANIKLFGNGSITPNKAIRASGGVFQLINSAYSAVILAVDDSGNTTHSGTVSATGYTGISSANVTTALGFTPYNATNPSGYTANTGTVSSITAGFGLTGGAISSSGTIALSSTAGGVGTYIFACLNALGTKTLNTTIAGSGLYASGSISNSGAVPTGTWQCMGYATTNIVCSSYAYNATLWLRIA